MTLQQSLVAVLALYFFYSVSLCRASLIINDANGQLNVTKFLAVPLHFGNSPNNFAPVSGFLVLANMTDQWLASYRQTHPNDLNPSIFIADFYSGPQRPYLETKLNRWAEKYSPTGVVIIGENFPGSYGEIGMQDVFNFKISGSEVSFPIVNVGWATWSALAPILTAAPLGSDPGFDNTSAMLNVTLVDDEPNNWYVVRRGWFLPTVIAISVVWNVTNTVVCILLLRQMSFQKNLAVVILCHEIAANIMRLPFYIDPFIGWLLPQPLISVLLTMSWPVHIVITIIVLFFWLELTNKTNIKASGGFLTSSRWPAAIAACTIVIVEYGTGVIRSSVGAIPIVLIINAAAYISLFLIIAISYIYVYAQVRSFIMSSPTMKSDAKLIQRVSIRLLGTAISFLVLIVIGILTSTKVYATAVGNSALATLFMWTVTAGSTLTISAFFESVRRNKLEASRRSSATAPITNSVGSNNASSKQPEISVDTSADSDSDDSQV